MQLAAKPKPRTSSYQRPKQREKPPFQRIMPVQQANVERCVFQLRERKDACLGSQLQQSGMAGTCVSGLGCWLCISARLLLQPQPVDDKYFCRRLERAVVCGRLWYQGCREANQDLPKDLPVTFASATQYIKAYEPLIFEEARESLLRCRLDQYTVESPARVIRWGVPSLASGQGAPPCISPGL